MLTVVLSRELRIISDLEGILGSQRWHLIQIGAIQLGNLISLELEGRALGLPRILENYLLQQVNPCIG